MSKAPALTFTNLGGEYSIATSVSNPVCAPGLSASTAYSAELCLDAQGQVSNCGPAGASIQYTPSLLPGTLSAAVSGASVGLCFDTLVGLRIPPE